MSKYHSKKVEYNGIKFDSKRELKRYLYLSSLEEQGKIQDLQRQVKYELIPTQYSDTEKTKTGKAKVVERPCSYVADFVYKQGDKTIVEDSKGFKTKDYTIKRKLMKWVHGIEIREV